MDGSPIRIPVWADWPRAWLDISASERRLIEKAVADGLAPGDPFLASLVPGHVRNERAGLRFRAGILTIATVTVLSLGSLTPSWMLPLHAVVAAGAGVWAVAYDVRARTRLRRAEERARLLVRDHNDALPATPVDTSGEREAFLRYRRLLLEPTQQEAPTEPEGR